MADRVRHRAGHVAGVQGGDGSPGDMPAQRLVDGKYRTHRDPEIFHIEFRGGFQNQVENPVAVPEVVVEREGHAVPDRNGSEDVLKGSNAFGRSGKPTFQQRRVAAAGRGRGEGAGEWDERGSSFALGRNVTAEGVLHDATSLYWNASN